MTAFVVRLALSGAAFFFLTGCPQEPESPPPKTEKTMDIAFDGSSRVFTFDQNYDVNTFRFTGLGGRSVVLVKSNASNYIVPAGNTGVVKSERSLLDSSDSLFPSPSAPRAPAIPAGTPVRLDHTPLPRTAASGADSARSIKNPALRSASETGTDSYTEGSTQYFWVPNRLFHTPEDDGTLEPYAKVLSTLRAIGTNCYVWVPDEWFSDETGEASAWTLNDNRLNGAQCAELARVFDGAYPLVTGVLGYENGGGETGDGGVDRDRRIHIFAYDIDYDWYEADSYGNPQTGGAFGYFDSSDLMNYTDSNKCEIFYIDAYFTDFFPNIMYSTLVHEFQHMIYYTSKNQSISPYWFNEMLSMLAEDFMQDHLKTIVGSTYNIDEAGPIEGRIPLFNGFYDESGVTDWLTGTYPITDTENIDKVLFSYSSAYAFGAYLVRNYGGIRLVSEMEKNCTVGAQSVTEALHAAGFPNESFESVFARYGEALVYNAATAGSSDVRRFDIQTGPTEFPDGSDKSYSFMPFIIHDKINENTRVPIETGPCLWNLEPWPLRPWGLSLLSSSAWHAVADSVSITLEKPLNPLVQLQLMVVGP